MEPVNPLTSRGHELLTGYRARTPTEARARSNWVGIQRKLDAAQSIAIDDGPPPQADDSASWVAERTRGRRWSRTAKAIGLSFAIAAAIVLLIRGAWTGARAMTAQTEIRTQAIDQAQGEPSDEAWSRRASPSPRSTPRDAAHETTIEAEVPKTVRDATATGSPPSRLARGGVTPTSNPAETAPPTVGIESSLTEQTRLLVLARAALTEKRYADALRVSRDYRRRFAHGALLEEQMAIEAMAECGMPGEHASASTFLAAYPSSPHAPRVRVACRVGQ